MFVGKEIDMIHISRHRQPIMRDDDPGIGTDRASGRVTAVRGHRRRFRRSGALRAVAWRTQVGVVALAAVMVAGCWSSTGSTAVHGASGSRAISTSTTTTVAPSAAHGVDAAIGDVPWWQVGPGWMLAMWSPVTGHWPGESPAPGEPTPETATTTLYLVDPAGDRYAITTFPPPGNKAGPELVDWSGDGRHALFYAAYSTPPTVISVDLHTGTQTTFTADSKNPSYTRPDGRAILLSTSYNGNVPGTLKRVDLAGNQQLTYPTDQLGAAGQFSGAYLESPDGTQLVLGTANRGNELVPRTDNGLVVVGNDGVVGRALPMPEGVTDCSPVRWWTSTVILASCAAAHPSGSQLWQVPLNGAAPTALTAVNTGHDGPDYGDTNAWQLPSGTFLQSLGACGSIFLSRLTPDMHTTKVTVPGVTSSVLVTGATADKLVLLAKVGCGGTTSLLTYDPVANTSTVLLGPPVNGGGVIDALLYPGQN
jgi:TolB protein